MIMLDALTLDQMRTFVAVADSGSFRAGAGNLSRAQSGVSVSIANLEIQLGLELFDRSGHRPVITPEGQSLLSDARDILLRVDTMRARARGFSDGVELELSIIVDTLFSTALVGAAIAQMTRDFPATAIRLSVEPLGGPLQALIEGRYTLAIMVGEDFRDPAIAFDSLSTVSLVSVAAPLHPLAALSADRELGVPDLADHVQIVLSDPTKRSEGRNFGVLSTKTCRVTDQGAKHDLILAGVGWGRLPVWQVEDDLQLGRLVRLRTASLGRHGQTESEIYLARRLDEPFGPAARLFTHALKTLSSI
jgi:DNA-binding transcriptional LysR family regulator